jgi:hypothetical protein
MTKREGWSLLDRCTWFSQLAIWFGYYIVISEQLVHAQTWLQKARIVPYYQQSQPGDFPFRFFIRLPDLQCFPCLSVWVYHSSSLPRRRITSPPPMVFAIGEEYEVKRILDSHKTWRKLHHLVLWKGYPILEATWELRTNKIVQKKKYLEYSLRYQRKSASFGSLIKILWYYCHKSYNLVTAREIEGNVNSSKIYGFEITIFF